MNNNTDSGLELLSWSKMHDSFIPVIMMSGHGNIETAMKAAKNGAYDFIEKPFKSERLTLLVDKAIKERNLKIKVLDFELKVQLLLILYEIIIPKTTPEALAKSICIYDSKKV